MNTDTDETLRAAREALLARGSELRERERRVAGDLRRDAAPLPRDAPDAAVVTENDEVLAAIGESARSELRQIERALERVEAGTYGVCDRCGERIESERLRVVPYAAHCARCAPDS